jgi:hypothetical protein
LVLFCGGLWLALGDAERQWESRISERTATYDRYMKQCLTTLPEYECAIKLRDFKP